MIQWHSRGRRFDPDYLHHSKINGFWQVVKTRFFHFTQINTQIVRKIAKIPCRYILHFLRGNRHITLKIGDAQVATLLPFHEPFPFVLKQINFLLPDPHRVAHAQAAARSISYCPRLQILRFSNWSSGTILQKWLPSARTNPHPPEWLDLHCGYFSRRSFNRSNICWLSKFPTMSAIAFSRVRTNP